MFLFFRLFIQYIFIKCLILWGRRQSGSALLSLVWRGILTLNRSTGAVQLAGTGALQGRCSVTSRGGGARLGWEHLEGPHCGLLSSPPLVLQPTRFEPRCLGAGGGVDTPRRGGFGRGRGVLSTAVFPLPGWATCPQTAVSWGGQLAWGFSNGPQFLEGAGRRDKTAVTRGP